MSKEKKEIRVNIDSVMYDRFKSYCDASDRGMPDVVKELISIRVEEYDLYCKAVNNDDIRLAHNILKTK